MNCDNRAFAKLNVFQFVESLTKQTVERKVDFDCLDFDS